MTKDHTKLYLIVSLVLVSLASVSCETLRGLFRDKTPENIGEVPGRPMRAMTGSRFLRETWQLSAAEREKRILAEIKDGNIPNFLRRLKPIRINHGRFRAVFWVMPDYLAIGPDWDYVRIPMTPMTAQKIADSFGYVLPTTKLVDNIYRQARTKLTPKPLPPGRFMTSNDYYWKHNKMVQRQIGWRGKGGIVSGHKKDIVITNRLLSRPTRVAIYGWHRRNGKPIQPLSLVHGEHYADYSHGARMIRAYARVNGKILAVSAMLKNKELAPILSYEGVMQKSRLHTDVYDINELQIATSSQSTFVADDIR